jgi:hypothetical protein
MTIEETLYKLNPEQIQGIFFYVKGFLSRDEALNAVFNNAVENAIMDLKLKAEAQNE